MNKNNFYKLIIALLLITNIFLLFLFIKRPKNSFNPDTPKKIIIERLHFDEKQIIKYQELINEHRKNIRNNDQKIIELKKQLYLLLLSNTDSLQYTKISKEIGNIQQEIEITHFKHFNDIKALCKPNQINDFNKLCYDFVEIFNHKKHNKIQ
jgi:protein CpxP